MTVSWVLNHPVCWKWCLPHSWKGGASRQIRSNAGNIADDSVGICLLSWGPNCDFMQVPKDREACSQHAIKTTSGHSSKTHLLCSKPCSSLSQNRKKVSVGFFLVNYPVVPTCLHLLVYMQGRFMVPGCFCFCLATYVSSEPWMLVSSVLCSADSHDRDIGWHVTLHRRNSEMMPYLGATLGFYMLLVKEVPFW